MGGCRKLSQPGEKSYHDWRKENPDDNFINFKDNRTQRMTFDPNSITRIFTGGKYGDTPAVPVQVGANTFWLRVKSKSIKNELDKVKSRSLIEVTQEGEGSATRYKVKVISK